MPATSLDLSQIKTDALSSASTFRSLIGLGTLATQNGTISDYLTTATAASTYLPLSGGTLTSTLTLPRLTLSGNVSAAAWTTGGLGIAHVARTLTDTSSTGTVAAAYTNVLGGNTIAASNATTFTDYATLQLGQPTAGTNVTLTNRWALDLGGALRSSGYSLTGSQSQSLVDLAGTWNTTGTPTLIKANVTDTASNASSLLMDLQVGSVSKFKVSKAGAVTIASNLTVSAVNIVTDTTTGTKIGTATTQKLGFWNATPVVQPTTAVGSATVNSPGGGNTIKTDDTFDGYTVAQIVKALRDTGILA
jgi:hypothetical protein